MNSLICSDVVTLTAEGAPLCASGWLTQAAVVPFDVSQILPEVAAQYFVGGFILCLTPWAAAMGVRHLLRLIQY